MRTSLTQEIRAEMARQGVTRQALSEQIGVSPKSLSRALNNKRQLGFDEFVAIATALGRPASAIVAEAEKEAQR